jgi:nucleotide-binding universal stress UspA family protein
MQFSCIKQALLFYFITVMSSSPINNESFEAEDSDFENETPYESINQNLQTIMIAIDQSKESDYAVRWSAKHFIKLKDVQNQKVILFTCLQSHPNIKVLKNKIPFLEEIEKKVYEQNCANLRKQREILLKTFPDAEMHLIVTHGKNSGDEIVDYALKNNVETVVMGAMKVGRGIKSLKRAFLGSVGHTVINHVHCPVVLVKHP